MALSNLLGIARSAIFTHQRAVDVTGHNIANAATEGYTRQRASIKAETPARMPWGFVGRGVKVDSIERSRNEFLDNAFRSENSALGKFSTLKDMLSEIEMIFGEPSENGLNATLDAFWDAWNDLANSPISTPARTVVQMQGRQVARQFNLIADRITDTRSSVIEQLSADVGDLNALATQVGALNQQIASSAKGVADLADERDRLLDQMSGLAPVSVAENSDGSVRVFAGDTMLVDGVATHPLAVHVAGDGSITLAAEGRSIPATLTDGRVAAYLDLLDTGIPEVRQQLDDLTEAVVSSVNSLHRSGATLAGGPAGDFFNPNGTTAISMALATDVNASVESIAAGSGSGPGDGSVALSIADLRNTGISSLGGATPSEYYTVLISELGQDVRSSRMFAEAQETLVSNFDGRRKSESGVSIDEEMINLISHQTAYAAATRLITVADEMMQDVLRMV